MFSLLLAAIFTPAAPTNAADWMGPGDYPRSAISNNHQAIIPFRLLVSSDGKVTHCELTHPSDFSELNRSTCNLLTRRARFTAARDSEGRPIITSYQNLANWLLPLKRDIAPVSRIGLQVALEKMPAGLTSPSIVELSILTSADGTIEDCAALPGQKAEWLAAVACSEAAKLARLSVVTDATGQPIRAAQSFVVQFGIAQ